MTVNGLTPDTLDAIYQKGAAQAPAIDRPDGGKDVLMPEGYTAHTIPPLEKPLTRIRQSVAMYDTASFTAYVNRYKSNSTRLFAVPGHLTNDKKAIVSAILDYHSPEKPDHGAHVARYLPRYSEQWLRWSGAGQPMPQANFAEFIEENRADIRSPDAAQLLDIVSKFKATKKQEYNSVVHQPNGNIVVGWSDETEYAGKPGVTVPAGLELGIPVFFKGTLYSVPVLMRYRLSEGKLSFTVKLDAPAVVEQAAFDEITGSISEATGIEIYLGTAA